jgi:hypothetical protein
MHKKLIQQLFDIVLTYIKPKRKSAEPAKTRFDERICRDLWQLICYATIILENDNNKGTPIQEQEPKRGGQNEGMHYIYHYITKVIEKGKDNVFVNYFWRY